MVIQSSFRFQYFWVLGLVVSWPFLDIVLLFYFYQPRINKSVQVTFLTIEDTPVISSIKSD